LAPEAQWFRSGRWASEIQKGRNVHKKRALEKTQRASKEALSRVGRRVSVNDGAGLSRAWPQAPRPGSQFGGANALLADLEGLARRLQVVLKNHNHLVVRKDGGRERSQKNSTRDATTAEKLVRPELASRHGLP
jgi:hypothetical protein